MRLPSSQIREGTHPPLSLRKRKGRNQTAPASFWPCWQRKKKSSRLCRTGRRDNAVPVQERKKKKRGRKPLDGRWTYPFGRFRLIPFGPKKGREGSLLLAHWEKEREGGNKPCRSEVIVTADMIQKGLADSRGKNLLQRLLVRHRKERRGGEKGG